jgi:hypothetical protein
LAYSFGWKSIAAEDPDQRAKLGEKAMEFYDKAQHHFSIMSFLNPRGGALAPPGGYAEYYLLKAEFETDSEKKLEFLKRSEKAGVEALKVAEISDIPYIIEAMHHIVSKTLQHRASIESDFDKKRSLLEKAMKHREKDIEIIEQLTPFDYWNAGVMQNYLAEIKAELANIEPNLDNKRRLLEEAVSSKEKCLELCNKAIIYHEKVGNIEFFAALRLPRHLPHYCNAPIRLNKQSRTPQKGNRSPAESNRISQQARLSKPNSRLVLENRQSAGYFGKTLRSCREFQKRFRKLQ